jgi:cytochrome c553
MMSRWLVLFLVWGIPWRGESEPAWAEAEAALAAKCYGCHGGEKTKGGVDLKVLAGDPKVDQEFDLWAKVMDTIEAGDMPPPKAKPLTGSEAGAITAWVGHALDRLAAANEGDPGPVTMRRLTHGEYERTIRDLTGQPFPGLTDGFQADGGGGEGFSNTGDVLFLGPAALDKYFSAARRVADHATVMPGTGIRFHPQRIGLRGPEQVKAQAEQGLYVWYQQKAGPHLPKDFEDVREADHLLACWKHRHFGTSLEELAKKEGLRLPFLENWWRLVNSVEPPSRYLDLTRVAWRELPGPDPGRPGEVPEAVRAGAGRIQAELRSWNNPQKPGSGVQRWQQDADGIRPYPVTVNPGGADRVFLNVGDAGDGNAGDVALVTKLELTVGGKKLDYRSWLDGEVAAAAGEAGDGPGAEAARRRLAELQALRSRFGSHPHPGRKVPESVLAVEAPQAVAFPVPAKTGQVRAEVRLDLENPAVDQATVQWTMTSGKARELSGVIPGVLTVWKRETEAAKRAMADFNRMKEAFPDMYERRLEQVADNLYRSRPGLSVYYFSDEQLGSVLGEADRAVLAAMRKDWRLTSPRQLGPPQREEFDGAMIWHVHRFAERAWRRPLAETEKEALAALYRDGVGRELDRESSVREALVRILVSPHFLFKAETLPSADPSSPGEESGDVRLSDWEIASRLSYFLWSSLPDDALRREAAAGGLGDPERIAAQAKRMLADGRSAALAEEFAGQWLKFQGFGRHDGVDRVRYPEFTEELRGDMEREAAAFFARLFREDRPVMEIVTGKTTFLNGRLARFYGVPGVEGEEFREVDVSGQHRGGLLGMGAVLTKTSRPDRTSPVLRGDYLYQVVLGFSSPPPPPNVPELEGNGLKPASLREALLRHREDAACAVCHDRIDPLGFALEGFDPIGRHRATDEAGGAIDDTGSLKDGTTFRGFEGLREYLAKNREPFQAQFCRKLLGYALGRQVLPSDRALLDKMRAALDRNQGKVSAAVAVVVTSRQFRHRRAEPVVAAVPGPGR